MSRLKTVGIKELKNNLSAYLREVRQGARILVSDRNTVVAELSEPRPGYLVEDGLDSLLAEWAEEGAVRLPSRKKQKLARSPLQLPDGTARRLLDEERGEGAE